MHRRTRPDPFVPDQTEAMRGGAACHVRRSARHHRGQASGRLSANLDSGRLETARAGDDAELPRINPCSPVRLSSVLSADRSPRRWRDDRRSGALAAARNDVRGRTRLRPPPRAGCPDCFDLRRGVWLGPNRPATLCRTQQWARLPHNRRFGARRREGAFLEPAPQNSAWSGHESAVRAPGYRDQAEWR